ncbi:MAG: hypothetical protein ACOYM3_32735, partial [Terrimicrobiaceae bacterium]
GGGQSGRLVVTGAGTFLTNYSAMYIGQQAAAAGAFVVSNGAKAYTYSSSEDVRIGSVNNSSLTQSVVLVSDSGSLWNASANVRISSAAGGDNSMVVSNGASVVIGSGALYVGDAAGATGRVVVTGLGSQLRLNGDTLIGGTGGVGRVSIQAGATGTFQRLNILSGSSLQVSNSTSVVQGVFTNLGAVTVVNSSVRWQGNTVLGGTYFSDPSTNTFESNVTVTASGSFAGSNGDQFVFYRNVINQSTARTNFSLWQSAVLFTNGAGTSNHTYDVTGSGSANWGTGFTNFDRVSTNFAIGTLSIAPGNRLMITGQVGGGITNAVYVGWLDIQGVDFAGVTNYLGVSNVLVNALSLPDINLYYSITDHRNDWLTAVIPSTGYDLWNGGGLLLPIPEPSAVLSIGSAFALLAFFRRRV